MTFFTEVNPDALTVSPDSAAVSPSIRDAQHLWGFAIPAPILVTLVMLVVGGTVLALWYALYSRRNSAKGDVVRKKLTSVWETLPTYLWVAFCVVPPILYLVGIIR